MEKETEWDKGPYSRVRCLGFYVLCTSFIIERTQREKEGGTRERERVRFLFSFIHKEH